MPKTVNVFGHALPRGGLIAGGAVALGVTGYIIWKKHVAAASSPVSGATAYGYGSAYGYGAYAYGLGIATYGYGNAAYAYGAYGYGGGGAIGVGAPLQPPAPVVQPLTNAQWAASAEAYLTQTAGYDATTVAAALGKYLTGGALTSDQAAIVAAALAFENQPPIAGANGMPPAVNVGAAGGQTGTTPAGPGPAVKVPNVVGKSANDALATLTRAGLTGHLSSQRDPISTYKINSQTPGAGKSVPKGSTVDLGIVKT